MCVICGKYIHDIKEAITYLKILLILDFIVIILQASSTENICTEQLTLFINKTHCLSCHDTVILFCKCLIFLRVSSKVGKETCSNSYKNFKDRLVVLGGLPVSRENFPQVQ